MPKLVVRDDGFYVVDEANGNRELKLDWPGHVNANGGVVIRIPPRDVDVQDQIVPGRAFDMSDLACIRIAVMASGLTLAEIRKVRPALAQALVNAGVTEGKVD